jgi:precorrin-6Y C5,15-methyltransferase (decarboxylating)
MVHPILVVGVGGEGPASLPAAILERVAQADQLWGGQRLLAFWADHPAEKVTISADIAAQVQQLRTRRSRRVVVLASGDPGFYGIVGTLRRALPAGDLEIIPHVNSLQLAFARAGLDWNEAIFTSVHARPLAEVVGWAKRAAKLGILTDQQHTPGVIAQTLLEVGLADCRAIVAENLGQPDERLTDTRLSALPEREFDPLNVLLLVRNADWQPWPTFAPRPDEAYAHRRGLITKADVRSLSLARLALTETDTIWDIGAGSGAVSIEMAELAWRGQVFAIEHDPENLDFVRQNCRRFGVLNRPVVEGRAPAALIDLPAPAAVFIGGTGGEMADILAQLNQVAQPGCRVVMNLTTLENLHEALRLMESHSWSPQVTQVNLAQGQEIAGLTRLAPLNPVFIVSGVISAAT